MLRFLPLALFIAQCLAFLGFPRAAPAVAYIVMVGAPLLAAVALAWRGWKEHSVARAAWWLLATSLSIWSLGAFVNLWEELIRGHHNEMYRIGILAFSLATVPATFLLATDWRSSLLRYARPIDALFALALGYTYFLLTWSVANATSRPEDAGTLYLVFLLDAQNLYLTLGALVRWHVAEDNAERDVFRAYSIYLIVYTLIVIVNDHFIAGDPRFGPEYGAVVTFAFALLATFALWPASKRPIRRAGIRAEHVVRSASPILLAAALLLVSLALVRINYLMGTVGILIVVVGWALRSTVSQLRHNEQELALRQERSVFQAIAWTDAVTGIPNRHYLDAVLRRYDHERRTNVPMCVLMVDLDFFKRLNDRYGHPAGDECLRRIAAVLRDALVRPDDVIVRFGGEEFTAVLADTDLAGAEVVAERMRASVQALGIENLESAFGVVTVSIGISSRDNFPGAPPLQLVALADEALYQAKSSGRNTVVVRRGAVVGG